MKITATLILYLLLLNSSLFSQSLTNVVTFDGSNAAFRCYDIDPNGNIYFGGYFRGSGDTTFGNLPVITPSWYENGLSCRTDSTGGLDWVTLSHAGYGAEYVTQIKYDNGNVYCAGQYIDNMGFIRVNGQTFPTTVGCCDNGYLLKQTELGSTEWVFILAGSPGDLEMDNDGNSYVSTRDFLYKIDSSGSQVWRIPFGKIHSTKLNVTNDTLYVFGIFQDSLIYMGDTLRDNVQFDTDIFFAKFDLAGNYYGITQIGNSNTKQVSYDITADNSGMIYLVGYTDSAVSIGTTQICGSGKRVFITKLDHDMSVINCFSLPCNGGSGEIAFNSANEMYAVFNINDTIVINGNIFARYPNQGYEGGGVILKWDIAGNLMWYRSVATPITGAYNVEWVSAHLRKTINGKFVVAGQMHFETVMDNVSFNLANGYIPYMAYLEDSLMSTSINEKPFFNIFVKNPTKNNIEITFEDPIACDIFISDVTGKLIVSDKIKSEKYIYPAENLSPGVYFYTICTNGNRFNGKIILQK